VNSLSSYVLRELASSTSGANSVVFCAAGSMRIRQRVPFSFSALR
jgi:hypothetical protein